MKQDRYITFFNKVIVKILFTLLAGAITHYSFSQSHVKKAITTVVIDAGHGGKDPGSIGKNVYEKEVVLNIALKVGNYIKKNLPEVKVIYTRSTDVFIELADRAEIANKNQADLFISIHANWNVKTSPTGTETYAMGYSKAESNLDVAIKENSVIYKEDDYANKYQGFDPNSPESYIIFSLVQNTFLTQSLNLAGMVQEQFSQRASRADRGVKQAGFLVLWKTTMPSILIEVGFISNPEEEKFLKSDAGQEIMASAIFRAIRNYKNQIEGNSVYGKYVDNSDSISADTSGNTEITSDTGDTNIQSDTSKPVNSEVVLSDIKYSIQIASSKKPISLKSKYFKGLKDVKQIKLKDGYKYIVGSKNSYDEAVDYSKIVKNYFPDAFVVGIQKGKIISVKETLKGIKN